MWWGTVEIPAACGSEHFILIGAPGSGKTTLLHLTLNSVLPYIRAGSNRRAVVYDPKREIYPALLGMGVAEDRIIIANPFDLRASGWNIAADVTAPATALEIATILVPSKSEIQPFFPDAARGLLGGVMESLLLVAPGVWTFRDVVLALRNETRLKTILELTESTKHLVGTYISGTDAHRDIKSTIENVMRRLSFIAAAWEHTASKFSLEQWIKDESILLLGNTPALESTLQQLNNALLHRLSQLILTQPEARESQVPPQHWIFIDELRRAGKLDYLPALMVEGRSKGACVFLAFQDLPGFFEVYGDKLAREIIGSCRNKGYLKIVDLDTAKLASEYFGIHELEIGRLSESWSTSTTKGQITTQDGKSFAKSFHKRSLVSPSRFMWLPEANPKNGIHGYFITACINQPYHGFVKGDFINAHKVRPHPTEPGYVMRPTEHQYLSEWTADDLNRLGLQKFPDLLVTTETEPTAGENKQTDIPENKNNKPKNKRSPKKSDDDDDDNGEAGLFEKMPRK